MPVCGPKLSLCTLIISVWGALQLSLMGVFYYVHSVALAEDIPGVPEEINDIKHFYDKVGHGYSQAFMGVFYRIHAVALAEDIPGVNETITSTETFYTEVSKGYTQNAYNCWIAACLYLVTLALSAHQFWSNNRSSLSV